MSKQLLLVRSVMLSSPVMFGVGCIFVCSYPLMIDDGYKQLHFLFSLARLSDLLISNHTVNVANTHCQTVGFLSLLERSKLRRNSSNLNLK